MGFKRPNVCLMSGSILLSVMACGPSPQPAPPTAPSPVSPKPSQSVVPLASPSVSPTVVPSRPVLESRGYGRLCEPLPTGEIQASLKYPVDLAVTADGQDLYIVSKRCDDPVSQKPYANKYTFSDCGNTPNAADTVPRSYIYHLRPGQGLEILKIDGKPPLSCELGEDLEIDSRGRLYVTTPHNHRIYRIDPKQGMIEQMVEARQKPLLPVASPSETLRGPANLYMDKDQLYFRLASSSKLKGGDVESHLARLDAEQTYTSLAVFPPFVSSYYTPTYAFSVDPAPTGTKTDVSMFVRDGGQLYSTSSPYPTAINPPESFGVYIRKFSPFNFMDSALNEGDPALGDLKIEGPSRNIYVSHPSTNRLLEMSDSNSVDFLHYGALYSFAGSLEAGLRDGYSIEARFRTPMGLALDAERNLFVADMGNHAIRKITQKREVTTLYAEGQKD